jgi:hypothetical protein
MKTHVHTSHKDRSSEFSNLAVQNRMCLRPPGHCSRSCVSINYLVLVLLVFLAYGWERNSKSWSGMAELRVTGALVSTNAKGRCSTTGTLMAIVSHWVPQSVWKWAMDVTQPKLLISREGNTRDDPAGWPSPRRDGMSCAFSGTLPAHSCRVFCAGRPTESGNFIRQCFQRMRVGKYD